MPAHRTPASRGWAATAALLTAVALTSCGEDEPQIVGGGDGAAEAVTADLRVTALELEYPEDGLYEEGEDVTLYAALANTASTAYRLVDVVGPDFADARLVALDGSDGTIEIPENDNAYLEPEGAPSVILQDLGTSLRSSQSIEVTLVFENADGDLGEVTLEAPVAAIPPSDSDFEAPQDPSDD